MSAVLFAAGIANAQCDTTGECFCGPQGTVTIAQLIGAVNIALGQAACPSAPATPCACCACDFGDGDVQCGATDPGCALCVSLGGNPAADCSICGNDCSGGQTLCANNPQQCQIVDPGDTCSCCACDFGDGDVQCGTTDAGCAECVSLGGNPAADCSICGNECNAGETLCEGDPQQCQASRGATAAYSGAQSHLPDASRTSARAGRSRTDAYNR